MLRVAHRLMIGDVAMVGLSKEWRNEWSLAVLKCILYPDVTNHGSNVSDSEQFVSYTATEDGVTLVARKSVLIKFKEHWLNRNMTTSVMKNWKSSEGDVEYDEHDDLAKLGVLQISLSRFGLDRYGIVHAVSAPLHRQGIAVFYLSTYQTANVLVPSEDMSRVLEILQFPSTINQGS